MPRVAIPRAADLLRILCAVATCASAPACKRQGAELVITTEGTILRTSDPYPSRSSIFDGTQVTLDAARGETLGFLVYQRAPLPVTLLPTPPATTNEVSTTLYTVSPSTARRASTAMYGGSRGTGSYPDVLRALSLIGGRDLESRSPELPASNPIYIELAIPRSATPGPRALQLSLGEKHFAVTLNVHAVTLPDWTPRVWAYYDPRELQWATPSLGTGVVAEVFPEERKCIGTFQRFGVMLSPDLPLSAWPARRELLAGFPFIPVKLDIDHVADDVHGWITATQGTGQIPFTIPIDEPSTPEARLKVRALSQLVRSSGGGPMTFEYAVTAEPHPDLGDDIDLYIPLTPKKTDSFARWTYNGAPPRAGSMVLDAAAPGARTWGWLAWRWNIPIWYVWDALYWHDRHNRKGAPLPGRTLAAAVDATSFDDGDDHGNLDGVLALPGDATTPCLPTLRLAAIRRGQQDRALLELAAKCHPAETQKLVDDLIPRALGDAPKHGSPAWPTNDEAWDAARIKLLDLAACP